jgi:hypothetical protein
VKANGVDFRNSLDLMPGKYTVRFVIRDNVTGKVGSVTAPLTQLNAIKEKCGDMPPSAVPRAQCEFATGLPQSSAISRMNLYPRRWGIPRKL